MEEIKGFAQMRWADISEEDRLALIQETIDRMERDKPTNHPLIGEESPQSRPDVEDDGGLFRFLLAAHEDVKEKYKRMLAPAPGEGRG